MSAAAGGDAVKQPAPTPPPAAVAPVPAPPLPPVTTLHYQGPAPYPHPAVTDPTPEEQYRRYVAESEEQQRSKDRELQAARAAAGTEDGGGGGMMGKLGMFAKSIGHQVNKGANQFHGTVEARVRQESQERDRRKWLANFPEQHQAQWFADYGCKVMHAGQAFLGSIIITSSHINWLSAGLKESIPLSEVVSVVRSVCLPTQNQGPPFILPIPAPHVIPNCLQIFTKQMQVFQFIEWSSTTATATQYMTGSLQGTPLERCYNFVDHAWRAVTTVPVPGVEYQPAPHTSNPMSDQ